MNEGNLVTVTSAPLVEARWENVRRWTGLAVQFGRCSIACQVMAGFELLALHEEYQIGHGPASKSLGQRGLDSWRHLIERELQIPGRTGDRWMQMAKLFHAKHGQLDAPERLRTLLDVPPRQWSSDDTNFMVNILDQVTAGKSQRQFMIAMGLNERPKALPAPGPTPTEADVTVAEAAHEWREVEATLERYGMKFVALDAVAVGAQMELLAKMFNAREQWLKAGGEHEPSGKNETVNS